MTIAFLLIFFDFATLYLLLAALIGWPLWVSIPVGLIGLAIAWAGFSLGLKFG